LTTYHEVVSWGAWERSAAVLMSAYVEATAAAGAVPVLLPPVDPANAADAVAAVDAVIVTGGADVDPTSYGQERAEGTDQPRVDRDAWEAAVLDAALDADKPVLAICRGVQLLNVVRGGTLHQHVEGHRPQPGQFLPTRVEITMGSQLAGIVGEEVEVPCSHHQAIDAVGAGLAVTARAGDGTVEGLELEGRRFVVGVQWHPEEGDDPRLFEALVAAARMEG
jgi:gamma-glutamyl-gamma-aminobutyrate hydrolase PuuD